MPSYTTVDDALHGAGRLEARAGFAVFVRFPENDAFGIEAWEPWTGTDVARARAIEKCTGAWALARVHFQYKRAKRVADGLTAKFLRRAAVVPFKVYHGWLWGSPPRRSPHWRPFRFADYEKTYGL